MSLSVDVRSVRAPGGATGLGDARQRRSLGGVVVTVVGDLAAGRQGEWRAGRLVRMPVELRRPSIYLDPGVPDHERELAARGTRLVGTVKSGALVEVIDDGTRIDEWMASARAYCRRAIAAAVEPWSARSAAIVAAIVIGDRTELDEDVQRRLQEAGTYHVIAISGGNIAILASALIIVFRLLGFAGAGAMVAASVGLAAYAVFVGGGASVERATVMAVMYLMGRALDQRGPPMNTLASAAALLTAAAPLTMADPAFLLTCGATLAILLVAPVVAGQRGSRPFRMAVGLFAASLASEAMLLPIGARVFSRITVAGLALNFLAIPLMGVAQGAGMVLILLSAASAALARAAGLVAHLGAEGLVRSAGLVRFAPALTWRVAPPSWWSVGAYYAGGGAAWATWRLQSRVDAGSRRALGRVRRLATAVALGAAVWILLEPWTWPLRRGDGRLHATFIDVGQGDAAFLRLPGGETMLVDAGGLTGSSTFDVGDRVVGPVLRVAGVGRLADLVLTHGDADHVGGADAVLHEFRPRAVWEGVPVPRDATRRRLQDEARAVGARWLNVQVGDRQLAGDVELRVWHPPLPDWERQTVRNDDSIVLEVRWRDVSFVLTGDVEKEGEASLQDAIPPAPLRVVKVPHHGSLTSSGVNFLRMLRADVAVVSVGRGNPFGHPARRVLDRYRRAGAEVFRTDRDGAVTIETDGHSLSVSTFTGRRLTIR